MMKCGLLGHKLTHSYSPQIHSYLGQYQYSLWSKEPEQILDLLHQEDIAGLNVTVPYKKTVIPYLDDLTDTAAMLGAVNTIVRRNGRLIGHNTDYEGFRSMLQRSGLPVGGKKCLVLGSGGASNTVCAVLQEQGAHVVVISRSGEYNYHNLHLHADAAVIVNTTPVGMYPNNGDSPIDLGAFPHLEGVLDVIYNPARTQLLLDAENRGLVTMNGLWMLVAQAKAASEWFTGSKIPDEKVAQIHDIIRRQTENIILIGMPGCGKSTIGKILAELTGKELIDTDEQIVKLAGKSIPALFAEDGEAVFRDWETEAIRLCARSSGVIIATGGGCVTQERNYPLLHQNGRIFWLQRDPDRLPTDGRPLSQAGKLREMYAVRYTMYQRFADHCIDNNTGAQAAAAQILEVLK